MNEKDSKEDVALHEESNESEPNSESEENKSVSKIPDATLLTGSVIDVLKEMRSKRPLLWRLPQVQDTARQLREGIASDRYVGVALPWNFIEKINLKSPARILREEFEALIEQEGLTTSDKKPLGVGARKTENDVRVYVAVLERIEKEFPRRKRAVKAASA